MSKALPASEVVDAARDLALDIARNTAPLSVAISKRLLWEAGNRSVDETRQLEDPMFATVVRHPDAQEGIAAFVEKREPKWSGRPSQELPDLPSRP